ncbi:MAG TPA: methionyl-tRNA formyltransferase [Flavisolibacter sp.]|nr:methionyl-tRNA formyltransferase [Flavisolibacter sp.]
MKLAVLASGHLGLQCLTRLPAWAKVECVLTDSKSTGVIEWATRNLIPLFKGNPRTGAAAEFLKGRELDALFSINYLFVIEKPLIDMAPYALNIHGSLLPKYRGRTPHVWSIINNEPKTGFTIHLIDEGCDTGDIVLQKEFSIAPEMTGADVLKEFEALYPEGIEEALKMIADGRLERRQQAHSQATYYGKRTPEDGVINWDWQKERIYNWVRAQARPYPGAFAFYREGKVTIHRIGFHPQGFHYEEPNGKVLDMIEGKPVVKTPNGAIILLDFELNSIAEIVKGDCFHA